MKKILSLLILLSTAAPTQTDASTAKSKAAKITTAIAISAATAVVIYSKIIDQLKPSSAGSNISKKVLQAFSMTPQSEDSPITQEDFLEMSSDEQQKVLKQLRETELNLHTQMKKICLTGAEDREASEEMSSLLFGYNEKLQLAAQENLDKCDVAMSNWLKTKNQRASLKQIVDNSTTTKAAETTIEKEHPHVDSISGQEALEWIINKNKKQQEEVQAMFQKIQSQIKAQANPLENWLEGKE